MSIGSELNSLCDSANEESGPLVNNAPLTGYETKFFDDYHFSETTEIFIQESSTDSRHSNLHDSEISDDTIGRALSSPLFTQERVDKLITLQKEVCCHVTRCLSVMQELGDPLMSLVRQVQASEKIHFATQKMSKSGFFWNDKKEQVLADCRAEIQKHEF